jgi:hypothetical protein
MKTKIGFLLIFVSFIISYGSVLMTCGRIFNWIARGFSCFPNLQCEVKWDSETLNLLVVLEKH